MKKIFALALVAVFCLAGYGVSAQTQSKNQKLSPKQEKREAREQRRAQRQAEYERYIDSLVTSGNFQFIPNSMRVMPAKGAVMPYYLTVLNYTISNPEETLKEQSPNGWEVTFVTSLFSATRYVFTLDIYAKTGGATLTITNSWNITVQYSGTITSL